MDSIARVEKERDDNAEDIETMEIKLNRNKKTHAINEVNKGNLNMELLPEEAADDHAALRDGYHVIYSDKVLDLRDKIHRINRKNRRIDLLNDNLRLDLTIARNELRAANERVERMRASFTEEMSNRQRFFNILHQAEPPIDPTGRTTISRYSVGDGRKRKSRKRKSRKLKSSSSSDGRRKRKKGKQTKRTR